MEKIQKITFNLDIEQQSVNLTFFGKDFKELVFTSEQVVDLYPLAFQMLSDVMKLSVMKSHLDKFVLDEEVSCVGTPS